MTVGEATENGKREPTSRPLRLRQIFIRRDVYAVNTVGAVITTAC